MERWAGKIAVVTGASAGIGEAIAKALVRYGMVVVGLARRVDRVQEIAKQLTKEKGKMYALKADVSNEGEIKAAFKWVRENLKTIHVLVNNAGILIDQYVSEPIDAKALRKLYDVNVIGLSICTSEALQLMRDTGVDDGHIIHINSSKHAVTVLTEGLRRELVSKNSKIRVSSVSPGLVKTDIFEAAHDGRASTVFQENPYLNQEDIADAVIYVLGAPPHVQVHEITIKPVGEKM
ncbi:hypothetical protein J437_LFUL012469 [Ladona fulva]|uniref:Farnesol dehydrogenase n=1 Tax=Ladona fulva TaxID=123851 RepID=A0A8K0NY03_LADFU|nr:hypothetical protein J437_LFUL012469 [Ladona fulva]